MATDAVQDAVCEQTSIFQSNLPLREKLDRARTMPRSAKGARAVEIVDEKTPEIFRLLVRDARRQAVTAR
jgi:sporulation-control protein spo0M